ncbi:MAG: acyl-ACP--UDP-N-acetylglucosamine O-acyltransferase [Candidatus Electrothrix sp. AW2]|jgi:UDP-N-acetylglucosamine acyltransferase|nr:acyl-ACP--UDP-N-acetylglucosamine O-acyltransferase [Candidatus Electrothrix sp. AX1]MCI5118419.1 acyl-ACP--UDP-N-acetylglucosamine O-acyltransferase [Candidatus Electrothrix gigas]MCI5128766.1 acyl-ACP--UDP-N-acetylglucosamine O-acyltransferase [Candidatus Electrothrix gigas]MCI5135221.1 acyl-ACP--UDP-N-acetylglucosamine O-acyltransferase [Candidatus Electrothrix gigas]MCI5183075.1 acyl-ACP--UDP-N-acetylglucosamine O-acyltransferase [Candidatus Electrothrix gigas]
MTIHATAVVDSQAEIHATASVGAYSVIGPNVSIGPDTVIDAHVVISGHTTLGAGNHIGSFSSLGTPPQDMHYQDEPTELIIGEGNTIREYVSIHRGTPSDRGKTIIGNNNMLMAYCHVAHDCVLHDHVIMSNVATLGGHVEVGSYANLGGLVAVHQFCRIGAYTYVGGMSGISLDVPPYVILTGTRNRMRIAGVNKIGMRRNGMSREAINDVDGAFRIIFRSSPQVLVKEALVQAVHNFPDSQEVSILVDFFRESKRGVVKRTEDS